MDDLNPMNVLLADHEGLARGMDALQDKVEHVLRHAQDSALPLSPSRQQLDEMMELARYLRDNIYLHFRKEEQALFPVMEECAPDRNCTALMKHEHKEVLERCFQLQRVLRDLMEDPSALEQVSKLERSLFKFINSFKSHIRREEEVFYPMARACLSEKQLIEISQKVKR